MGTLSLAFRLHRPEDRIHCGADVSVALLQVDVRKLWAAASAASHPKASLVSSRAAARV